MAAEGRAFFECPVRCARDFVTSKGAATGTVPFQCERGSRAIPSIPRIPDLAQREGGVKPGENSRLSVSDAHLLLALLAQGGSLAPQ